MLREYLRRTGLLLGGLLVSAVGITLMLQLPNEANAERQAISNKHLETTE